MRWRERGIPAGPINNLENVFADPQVIHRNMRVDLMAPWAKTGHVPSIRNPIRFSQASLRLDRPAPRLGEHTSEILAEIREELP